MPNIKLMETALPVAPLKIAALDSCKEMGQKVNDYIVRFRQDTLKESLDSPLFSSYQLDNYPVSYTHLDVYKRQLMTQEWVGQAADRLSFVHIGHASLQAGDTWSQILKPFFHCLFRHMGICQ